VTSIERRQTPRRRPEPGEPLETLRLRTGHALAVINIGDLGGLLCGTAPLQPGARLELQLVASGRRIPIPATVLRCYVSRLQADAVWYESRVRFDSIIDTRAGYLVPEQIDASRIASGTSYPSSATSRTDAAPKMATT
jgi:hypothetical protein